MVDSDFNPWYEAYNDDDYGDITQVRPYVDVELRPNAASRKSKQDPEFTDSEDDDTASSGSDTESCSEESDSDDANDHDDADEDGVCISALAQAPWTTKTS